MDDRVTSDRRTSTDTALLAATALAAFVGGVLTLAFTSPGFWLSVLAVAAAVLVGTGLALLLTTAPRHRPTGLGTWPERDRRSGEPGPLPSDPVLPDPNLPVIDEPAVRPTIPAPRVVIPLPVEKAPPAAEWWTRTTTSPDPDRYPPASAAPPPAGVRPLPDYTSASALIAQCPRCGGFALDVAGARDGFRFGCRACAYAWSWTPGTPWPAVTVRPERPTPTELPRDDR